MYGQIRDTLTYPHHSYTIASNFYTIEGSLLDNG